MGLPGASSPAEHLGGQTRLLHRADDHEEPGEQHEQSPVDLAVDLLRIYPPREQRVGGAPDGHQRDRHAGQEGHQHDRHRGDGLDHEWIVYREAIFEVHGGQLVRKLPAVHQPDHAEHQRGADDRDRRLAQQERAVADVGEAAHQHVLRVAGEGRR